MTNTGYSTKCRWCGGEMVIVYQFSSNTGNMYWECSKCETSSKIYNNINNALAWASQPIPFLNVENIGVIIPDRIWETLTAALAVREEEQ